MRSGDFESQPARASMRSFLPRAPAWGLLRVQYSRSAYFSTRIMDQRGMSQTLGTLKEFIKGVDLWREHVPPVEFKARRDFFPFLASFSQKLCRPANDKEGTRSKSIDRISIFYALGILHTEPIDEWLHRAMHRCMALRDGTRKFKMRSPSVSTIVASHEFLPRCLDLDEAQTPEDGSSDFR